MRTDEHKKKISETLKRLGIKPPHPGWGQNHVNWKGGRITRNGYIYLYSPEKQKYVAEHRVVMEKYLGRKLYLHEVIHHKNGNRKDNRLINLGLLDRQEHSRMEKIKNWYGKIIYNDDFEQLSEMNKCFQEVM